MAREQVTFDEMMTPALYYINTRSWIFIVLAQWSNIPRFRYVVPVGHIILIPSQPAFALAT